VGARAEPVVPPAAGVERANQVEEPASGRFDVRRQHGDLVAQSIQLRVTVRPAGNLGCVDLHGGSALLLDRLYTAISASLARAQGRLFYPKE
jgi:hypothetical protein